MPTVEEFRFGEVLGVLFGREVEIDGQRFPLEPIVSHILGMEVDRSQVPKMIKVCRKVLLAQLPRLDERKHELALLMDASYLSFADKECRFIVPASCKNTRLYKDIFLVQRVEVEYVHYFGAREAGSFPAIFARARGKGNERLN